MLIFCIVSSRSATTNLPINIYFKNIENMFFDGKWFLQTDYMNKTLDLIIKIHRFRKKRDLSVHVFY